MAIEPGNFMDFYGILNMLENREYDRVHEFNLMLVGEEGVGKSALVKSLFKGMVKPEQNGINSKICTYQSTLEENGVKLELTCIEARNSETAGSEQYIKYIDEQFKTYFINRRRKTPSHIKDTLVHCCLYLIPPYGGKKLKDKDIECMIALHEKVNLVPIIAKADCFDTQDLQKFKENILSDLKSHGIKYFDFGMNSVEDEEVHILAKNYSQRQPFAIVTADDPTFVQSYDGDRVRTIWVRKTRAGQIDILDEEKSDFVSLSKLLLRFCILELMDTTHEKHYSRFKSNVLNSKDRRKILESYDLNELEINIIERAIDPTLPKVDNYFDLKRTQERKDRELEELRDELKHLEVLVERANPYSRSLVPKITFSDNS